VLIGSVLGIPVQVRLQRRRIGPQEAPGAWAVVAGVHVVQAGSLPVVPLDVVAPDVQVAEAEVAVDGVALIRVRVAGRERGAAPRRVRVKRSAAQVADPGHADKEECR